MDRRVAKVATLTFIAFIVFSSVAVIALVTIGTVEFPYEIGTKATMTPDNTITINLGSISPSASKTVTSFDTNHDLNVATLTDVKLTLSGHTAFTKFSVTIELKGAATYPGTVDEATPSKTISSVAVGTYDIVMAYSYTAGSTPGSGTVKVTLEYP